MDASECKQQIHEKSPGRREGNCKMLIKLKGVKEIPESPACYHACVMARCGAMDVFKYYIENPWLLLLLLLLVLLLATFGYFTADQYSLVFSCLI